MITMQISSIIKQMTMDEKISQLMQLALPSLKKGLKMKGRLQVL